MAEAPYKPPTNVTVLVRPYGRNVPKSAPIPAAVADPIIAEAKEQKRRKWEKGWHDFSRLGANGNPEGAKKIFIMPLAPWKREAEESARSEQGPVALACHDDVQGKV